MLARLPAAAQPPRHLRPVAPLAPRVLLPGDPARALALAQVVLGDDRRMFNHHRGLWGYTGTAADGAPLTIQSTGIGGPSAAVVLDELAALGVTTALRVGTATALDGDLGLGDLVCAATAHGADGVSRTRAAVQPAALDAPLTRHLAAAGARAGAVVSTDLPSDPVPEEAAGALARDLSTAALAAIAEALDVRFAAVLAVVDDARGAGLDDDAVAEAGEAAGRLAAAALAAG